MTDLYEFAGLLNDVHPSMELIEGRIFLDRLSVGKQALLQKIAKYDDIKTAQDWINMVPIDDFIDTAVQDWSVSDPTLQEIVDVYRRSWLSKIKAQYGEIPGLSVEMLTDDEYGDVIVRLSQE